MPAARPPAGRVRRKTEPAGACRDRPVDGPESGLHPMRDERGRPVAIRHPSRPSPPSSWFDPEAAATFVPGGPVPPALHGVAFTAWTDPPRTAMAWNGVDGLEGTLDEPPFLLPMGMASSGVVIEEPDGRVWLVAPTNRWGGYQASFPKGKAEQGLSLQANAIKETFEESGLRVRITGFLGDYRRTMSTARLYRAVRIGGTPAAMGWESQAVHLVPKAQLYLYLNMTTDHGPAEAIGAGKP